VEADKLAPALGSLKIPDEAGMSTRRSAHHSSAPPVATSLVKEEPAKSKTVVSKKGLKPAAIKGQGKKRKVVEISDSSSDEKPSKKRPLKRRGGQGSLGGIGEAIMRASEASLTRTRLESSERQKDQELEWESCRSLGSKREWIKNAYCFLFKIRQRRLVRLWNLDLRMPKECSMSTRMFPVEGFVVG
jgi:hypothetical protein